jgi:hypothetical protein
MNTTQAVRANFGTLEIGTRFHCGKSYGMGATRDILSWEVMEKISKSTAKVVENYGSYRGNTMGHVRSMHTANRVFPV